MSFPTAWLFLKAKDSGRGRDDGGELTSFRADESRNLHGRKSPCRYGRLVRPATPDGIWATQDGIWVATLGAHAIALVNDGKPLRSIDTGTGFPIACCTDSKNRLFVTVADTAGQPLMETVASKTVSTSVFAYDLEKMREAS